jgi:hypothetical protein
LREKVTATSQSGHPRTAELIDALEADRSILFMNNSQSQSQSLENAVSDLDGNHQLPSFPSNLEKPFTTGMDRG